MSSQSEQEQDQDQENIEELPDEDQEQSSRQQESQKQAKSTIKKVRNYQKVPENLKSQLLKLAAQQLNLKYATAKTIVFTYRAQSKPKKSKNKKKKTATKVEFVPIQNNNVNPIHVEISIGGNVQNKFTLQ
ncbi:unnamed protein product [Paramecium pentaurelia]|uniref:Uncharacterized protein n=1 Tax=Paramecium pentaurelia TaxID=43138 RepID=A0A8S1TX36_9CILI|nr:unnamed protein product [Paramecium pentaurelia]CAD8155623.1 unnamed protein product [Paramecium pentaurelia]